MRIWEFEVGGDEVTGVDSKGNLIQIDNYENAELSGGD
jgi:hypothetical protein